MSTDVRIYRLYFLDSDNDVLKAMELAHGDDDTAMAQARSVPEGAAHHIELWQCGRLVKRWPDQGAAAEAAFANNGRFPPQA